MLFAWAAPLRGVEIDDNRISLLRDPGGSGRGTLDLRGGVAVEFNELNRTGGKSCSVRKTAAGENCEEVKRFYFLEIIYWRFIFHYKFVIELVIVISLQSCKD